MKRFNHLKIKELKELKNKMLMDKERIINTLNVNSAQYKIENEDRSDTVDLAASEFNNSHMLRMRNRELFYVKKIDNSLSKITAEEYGDCEDCGEEISYSRLMARPTADLCINCKEASEFDEQRSLVGSRSKSYSEVIDIATK